MQDNAIIIKLQDGDITTAQDDPDIEGIIHIPSIEYNHCVQEIQVPGQSFFNGLYLNVQDLDIGGSGLPIVIDRAVLYDEATGAESANTWEFRTVTQTEQITLNNKGLIAVKEDDDVYEIYYWLTFGVTQNITLEPSPDTTIRYYLFNGSIAGTSRIRLYSGNDQVITLFDNVNYDNKAGSITIWKTLIEFNWLTN